MRGAADALTLAGGGFPRRCCGFFHSHDCRRAGNHSRAVWVQNDVFGLHESVLHILWSAIRNQQQKTLLQSVNTGDLLWAELSWRQKQPL